MRVPVRWWTPGQAKQHRDVSTGITNGESHLSAAHFPAGAWGRLCEREKGNSRSDSALLEQQSGGITLNPWATWV